ncbi:uncharacterized protein N7525_004732 [Penicillium rubens]|uniref:uncharacterized protein n=1 Tax=Penicillium rubens TaxID=1108849 RepID=UPI002A5A728D|nr:uncharacterized protein N7525_004732 [Penicillium rubens]KAJ5839544.1 hypothetical protein N7525_004732 [Penicillium rubens]
MATPIMNKDQRGLRNHVSYTLLGPDLLASLSRLAWRCMQFIDIHGLGLDLMLYSKPVVSQQGARPTTMLFMVTWRQGEYLPKR